ncbi:MAG: hypothetical protein WDO74_06655 [Pseudomonadota bacterium]
MKSREALRTLVVNPFWQTVPFPSPFPNDVVLNLDRDEVQWRMLATIDTSRPGVAEKRFHTEQLLADAAEHTCKLWETLQHEVVPAQAMEYLACKAKQLGL